MRSVNHIAYITSALLMASILLAVPIVAVSASAETNENERIAPPGVLDENVIANSQRVEVQEGVETTISITGENNLNDNEIHCWIVQYPENGSLWFNDMCEVYYTSYSNVTSDSFTYVTKVWHEDQWHHSEDAFALIEVVPSTTDDEEVAESSSSGNNGSRFYNWTQVWLNVAKIDELTQNYTVPVPSQYLGGLCLNEDCTLYIAHYIDQNHVPRDWEEYQAIEIG